MNRFLSRIKLVSPTRSVLNKWSAIAVASAAYVAVFILLFGGRLRPGNASDQLRIELQKDSFSPILWSIAEFKVSFGQQFTELLLELQRARKANSNADDGPLHNAQLAEILKDAIAEVRRAISIEDLQACLLNFYRTAGLTNEFLSLFSELQSQNIERIVVEAERPLLEAITSKQPVSTTN